LSWTLLLRLTLVGSVSRDTRLGGVERRDDGEGGEAVSGVLVVGWGRAEMIPGLRA
jgi:hypothetical protein